MAENTAIVIYGWVHSWYYTYIFVVNEDFFHFILISLILRIDYRHPLMFKNANIKPVRSSRLVF